MKILHRSVGHGMNEPHLMLDRVDTQRGSLPVVAELRPTPHGQVENAQGHRAIPAIHAAAVPTRTRPAIAMKSRPSIGSPKTRMTSRPQGRAASSLPDVGALVVSLDFELLWGLKDLLPDDGGTYRENLLGVRTAVPRMLELFEEFGISATWATVGLLFAESRAEMESYFPAIKPDYTDPALSPYHYVIGNDEEEDPLHYAPSLISKILEHPGQEIGTHTFGHYYCLEPGQTAAAFQADLASAVAIAQSRGINLRSMVFPRNQHNPVLDPFMIEAGLMCYRGNRHYWPDQGVVGSQYFHPARRVGRLLDTYVAVDRNNSTAWSDVATASGLANAPANRFMGPRRRALEARRIQRVISEMQAAAKAGRIYHIWWHPHNFGVNQNANFTFLRAVLEVAAQCKAQYGMESLSMADVARHALPQPEQPPTPEVDAFDMTIAHLRDLSVPDLSAASGDDEDPTIDARRS